MAGERRKVLFLGLWDDCWREDSFDDFVRTVCSKAEVINYSCRVGTSTMDALEDGTVSVVVLFEPSVAENKHEALTDALVQFTKAGGTTVFAGFSLSTEPLNTNAFFSKWNLPWKCADCLRTTFTANSHARLKVRAKLPSSYSMKALYLKNVALEDLLYVRPKVDQPESRALPSESAKIIDEGPIVFARYHKGRIGWVGDVKTGEETTRVLLAMLGF